MTLSPAAYNSPVVSPPERTFPSGDINKTSTPSTAGPTVPTIFAEGLLTAMIGLVSVAPYLFNFIFINFILIIFFIFFYFFLFFILIFIFFYPSYMWIPSLS